MKDYDGVSPAVKWHQWESNPRGDNPLDCNRAALRTGPPTRITMSTGQLSMGPGKSSKVDSPSFNNSWQKIDVKNTIKQSNQEVV